LLGCEYSAKEVETAELSSILLGCEYGAKEARDRDIGGGNNNKESD
jgi:hypothetical protein